MLQKETEDVLEVSTQDGRAFSIAGYETASPVSWLWSQGTSDQDCEYLSLSLSKHKSLVDYMLNSFTTTG